MLPVETIEQKIRETYDLGGNQILLQGGHNPSSRSTTTRSLFRRLKIERSPDLWLHALSPPEIVHIYKTSRIAPAGRDAPTAARRRAGFDSRRRRRDPRRPRAQGTGQEQVLGRRVARRDGRRPPPGPALDGDDDVRPRRDLEERIEHLPGLRDLQDRTGGFTAFICWTYQAENTALGGDEVDQRRVPAHAGRGASVPRQHRQPAGLVGHAGAEDGRRVAGVRRQRHGQHDDRGKRRHAVGERHSDADLVEPDQPVVLGARASRRSGVRTQPPATA